MTPSKKPKPDPEVKSAVPDVKRPQPAPAPTPEATAKPSTTETPKPVVTVQKPEAQKAPTAKDKAMLALIVAINEAGKKVGAENLSEKDGNLLLTFNGCIRQVGKSGGYSLPQIRSYARADVATMVAGDELLKKQTEKDAAKKQAAAQPKTQDQTTPATA